MARNWCVLLIVVVIALSHRASAESFCQSEVRSQADVDKIRAAVDGATFSDEKVNALVWGVKNGTMPLSPEQFVYVLKGLTFSSDLANAVATFSPWLTGFTPNEMIVLLGVFTFSSDKIDALGVFKDFFREDLFAQRYNCCTAFDFSSDQEKCRAMLNSSSPF